MNRYHQYTVGIDLRQQAMALMHALGNPDSRLPTLPLVQDNRHNSCHLQAKYRSSARLMCVTSYETYSGSTPTGRPVEQRAAVAFTARGVQQTWRSRHRVSGCRIGICMRIVCTIKMFINIALQ